MAGKPLVLRVRTKKGVSKLQLNATSTVLDLKQAIVNSADIDYSNIKTIRYGYPPKVILDSDESSTLSSLSIREGELITVEEGTGGSSNEKKPTDTTSEQSNKLQDSKKDTPATSGATSSSSSSSKKNFDGVLLRKVVPANNSCLFTSVYFVMENGVLNLDCQKSMRELIAKTVKNDPVSFNEAILGKKNSDYCNWIRNPTSWGGSIEIMILSKYYKCEICVVDIRTGRIDRFGEDCMYPTRVFIIYDGIHFDPLYLQINLNKTQTKFSTQDDLVMIQAVELATEAKNAKQFTDVNKFKLRCLVCQQPMCGQQEAQTHAQSTGHINFGEF